MADETQIAPVGLLPEASHITPGLRSSTPARWSLPLRIAFRFCFAYLGAFCFTTQIISGMLPIPILDRYLPLGPVWASRQITFWTAAHVFRVNHPLVYTGSGSGDKTFDWVQSFCLLVIAAGIAALWPVLDRRRVDYVTLHKWFRIFLRFALAGQMLGYGFEKVIPLQMSFPFLLRLVEPYGNFSPMGVLWSSTGASPAYEIFAGSAEVLGGLLLLTPRTTTLGALVCLADMIQVFTLNMTYDVPAKLLSFHLILISLFLLAPDGRRLFSFFFSDRPTGPSTQPPLFRSLRVNRWAIIVQAVLGLYLAGVNAYGSIGAWNTSGGGRPKPALYGIWNIEKMSVNGQERLLLITDHTQWRRMIFDFMQFTTLQQMDGNLTSYNSSIDTQQKFLTLTKRDDKDWKATFIYTRPAPDQLLLDGTMDGRKIQMQLKLLDRDKFNLVNRGFHWINEYPYQR